MTTATLNYAEALREAAAVYDRRNDGFAAGKGDICRDIANRYEKAGGLFASDKQHEFADKLIAWSKPKAEAAPVGQVNNNAIGRIRAMFASALSAGLRFPKIRLQTPAGDKLVIATAGPNSRYAGDLMLTDGGSFGDNVWYGRINGTDLIPSRSMSEPVRELLLSLGDKPEQAAEAYGRLTNSCCFCGRELTDGRSVAAGYGPICAGKFGLAWGSEKVDTVYSDKEEV